MARESIYQVAVLCNLILTTIYITAKIGTTAAIERPFHLAIATLFWCSLGWYLVGRWSCIPKGDQFDHGRKDDAYSKLESGGRSSRLWQKGSRFFSIGRGSVGSVALHIILRMIMTRWIIGYVECSWNGIEIFLPLWLLLLDPLNGVDGKTLSQLEIVSKLRESHFLRYLFLLVVWIFSAYITIGLTTHNSTYICPQRDNWRYHIRLYQVLAVGLDAGIIYEVSKIAQGTAQTTGKSWKSLSMIALLSAAILGFLASIFLWRIPEYIPWSLHIHRKTKVHLFLASLLCTNFVASVVYLLHELRHSTIFMIVSCVSVCTTQISMWPYQFSEVVGIRSKILVAVCLSGFASMVGLVRAERDASRSQRHMSLNRHSVKLLMGLVFLMASAMLGSALVLQSRSNDWPSHPIRLLMSEAKLISNQWAAQAGTSKTLAEAVVAYQTRYGVYPPPNFDKWYEFAVARKSAIIDDFDQIHKDLLPFWGMEPAEIRLLTSHILERPWTEVAGVRISNKTASITPHMPPTHRWMVEGAVEMMNTFVEWLPDMDLAFNINDESRVAVPWNEMEKLKHAASLAREEFNKTRAKMRPSFFPHVIDVWEGSFMDPDPPNGVEVPSEFFEGASFRSSFKHYGSVGCPPNSLARQQHWSNQKSFCRYCPSPHSLGTFVRNWTLSGSTCHQPDIANLHGIHLSPSAFKSTNKLFPIFSQSKVPSFNDIIYPSPWNYWNKVTHDSSKDMPFAEKDDTMFWRGAPSEGFAIGGTWQGMQRQRFVHLVNYTPNDTSVNLILPDGDHFSQSAVHVSDIKAATTISVEFVDKPTRCATLDCQAEGKEFVFGPPVEFQDHWRYKYLFDLDGAGFSGRFLPFIESHSLVFRAAAFRQWFDERLVAWKHFVPVDGRLHDVWGLLAYFGGIGEKREDSHQGEAERISEDGRDWALKVLRKEDMEVYMFRLLLEWGRIVDDRRTQLGFVMPVVP